MESQNKQEEGRHPRLRHQYDLENQCLLVIDIPNRKMLSPIPLQFIYPRVVVITPDGTQAWVN
jgi:hypothetical protein